MITCPRCGAENKDDATVCRMCATALDPSAVAAQRPNPPQNQEIPATVLVPTPGGQPPVAANPGGKVTCPGCGAANDSDWAFCQQCGTRLTGQQAAGQPQQPSWGAPTVVTPAPPDPQQQWGAPTVIAPAPDFSSNPPPQQPGDMPPSWGAPTVVTPAPPQGAPPPQQPQQAPPQQWGAPTVISPAPDFNQPPPPPQGGQPSWGAPTVVTQAPDLGQPSYGTPAPPDQRYVQTMVDEHQDINQYPETIVTPPAPPPPPVPDEMSTAQVPRQPEPEQAGTAPVGHGATADMSQPPQPVGSQSTIVMSSTPVATPPKQARLLLIMEGGEIGETFSLRPTETVVGRVDGDIKFPHDGYMSSRHARILQRNGRFFLIDNNSRNGTFVKIHQEVELHPGDVVLVGKQLFRFETDE